MVELIEYVIAFAISAGVAGASVLVVNGAMPGLGQMAAASKSDQIAGAARIAVVEGRNVTLLLPFKDSSIACSGGAISVSEGGASLTRTVGFPCSFSYKGLSGACALVFSTSADSLRLEVKC
jgi:hypothetical protein